MRPAKGFINCYYYFGYSFGYSLGISYTYGSTGYEVYIAYGAFLTVTYTV